MNYSVLLKNIGLILNHRIIKNVIGLILLVLIYHELKSKGTFSQVGQDLLQRLTHLSSPKIGIIIFLMLSNLFLESYKWKFSLARLYDLSIFESFRSIVTGTSFGIITPHGVGDYGGRLMYLSANKRIEAGIINFINSLSQNIVHVVVGTIGLFVVLGLDNVVLGVLYSSICLFFVLFLLWFYFDLKRFEIWLVKWIKNNKWQNRLKAAADLSFSPQRKLVLILLSFFRYTVYTTLFVYLLFIFGANNDIVILFLHVAVIFLIQSGIPLPASVGALARIEIAILILSRIEVDINVIILSSLSIWILNLIIPSLIGILMMSLSDGTKIQTNELIK